MGERGRETHLDPLVPLCALVAATIYATNGLDGGLSKDVGVYSYGGQQFADGVLPYVSVLNRAGPLAHVIPGLGALAARGVGIDDLYGMRVLFLLISAACVALAYCIGRDLYGHRLAGLVSAAAMVSFEGFTHYATYGPREKSAMVLFLLTAMLAVVHQRWLTCGVFISLATLTWQPVFFAIIIGAVTAILVGLPSGRIRALVRVAAGGLIPLVVFCLTYAVAGETDTFADAFLLINAEYTNQASVLERPAEVWQTMVYGYGLSFVAFLLGIAGSGILALHALTRRDGRLDGVVVGFGTSTLAGLAWSTFAFDYWPDSYLLLPGAAVGFAGLVDLVVQRLPRWVGRGTVASFVVLATVIATVYTVGTRSHDLEQQRSSVATVLGALPPDSQLVSVGAPGALVLSGRRNPTRYQLFGHGLLDYIDDTWPGGIEDYGQRLVDKDHTVLAVRMELRDGAAPWFYPGLHRDYVRVGATPYWAWFVRKDVGREVLDQLRRRLNGSISSRGTPEARPHWLARHDDPSRPLGTFRSG